MKGLYSWWKSDVDFFWKGKLVLFSIQCTTMWIFFLRARCFHLCLHFRCYLNSDPCRSFYYPEVLQFNAYEIGGGQFPSNSWCVTLMSRDTIAKHWPSPLRILVLYIADPTCEALKVDSCRVLSCSWMSHIWDIPLNLQSNKGSCPPHHKTPWISSPQYSLTTSSLIDDTITYLTVADFAHTPSFFFVHLSSCCLLNMLATFENILSSACIDSFEGLASMFALVMMFCRVVFFFLAFIPFFPFLILQTFSFQPGVMPPVVAFAFGEC